MKRLHVYFIVVIAGWIVSWTNPVHATIILDQFDVDSAQATPTSSSIVLASGEQYLIEVSGFYQFNLPSFPNRQADAEYHSDDAFGSIQDNPNGHLDLLVVMDGFSMGTEHFNANQNLSAWDVDWGPFNPSHEYSLEVTGTGVPIGFVISDIWQTGPSFGGNTGVFDNAGSLTVTISQESAVPEPSSFVLWGIGALGIIGYIWRSRKLSRK